MRQRDSDPMERAHSPTSSRNDGFGGSSSNSISDSGGNETSCSHFSSRFLRYLPASRFRDEIPSLVLLTLLYTLQGVPLGMTFATLPFMLQSKVTYTDLGIFSLASYPYSLKLFWSPIVDTFFSRKFGRRKSWIIPTQLLCALIMLILSTSIDDELSASSVDVWKLSALFTVLVLLAATQDIAVDGWALTMLSLENRGFAATVQSIGLEIGIFLSFTVFLALNSADFCNKFLFSVPRVEGLLQLSTALQFWAWAYVALSVWLLLVTRERDDNYRTGPGQGVMSVYRQLGRLTQLRAVRVLMAFLVLGKVGLVIGDSIVSLKLIERGFKKEDLAMFVLVQFPLELLCAVLAGRWCAGRFPLQPFVSTYNIRIGLTLFGVLLIYFYPSDQSLSWGFYGAILLSTLVQCFVRTVMFVAQMAFFTRIVDPSIGGTYLTLLNTVSNFGSSWPPAFIYYALDFFTVRSCLHPSGPLELSCAAQRGSASATACAAGGGLCVVERDGFYLVAGVSLLYGVAVALAMRRWLLPLQRLGETNWRVGPGGVITGLIDSGGDPGGFAASAGELGFDGGGGGGSSTRRLWPRTLSKSGDDEEAVYTVVNSGRDSAIGHKTGKLFLD